MARIDVKKTIYADLLDRDDLLDLLGPVSQYNRRIYAAYPQEVPRLSGNNVSEGWLIFYEEQSVISMDSIAENIYMDFHTYATDISIGEAVIDILDELYNWRIAGQNSRAFGNRRLTFVKRIHTVDRYDENTKLYVKIGRYRFVTVADLTTTV